MIEAYFDGCVEPRNPGGHGGYGAVVIQDGRRIWETSKYVNPDTNVSNNVMEYMAFLAILEYLLGNNLHRQPIKVYGDSKLVIQQMFGRWKMHGGYYIPTAQKAKKILCEFPNIKGEWIPREENSLADELSKAELIKAGVEFRIQPEEKR